jgi:flagellar basal-body rod modification protein FlgD
MATSAINGTTAAAAASTAAKRQLVGQNFDTFLQLLTTQLKSQNPLDPLDTNQFTQQLVQFAQVEQQMNMNTALETLIALQKASQLTQSVDLIGKTVTVDGDTGQLKNGLASWSFSAATAGAATVTITDALGQNVYARTMNIKAGSQNFIWDGKSNSGLNLPDGKYKIAVSAADATGQSIAISTEVTGTVDSVDLTQQPAVMSIGGQTFTFDAIKQVRAAL